MNTLRWQHLLWVNYFTDTPVLGFDLSLDEYSEVVTPVIIEKLVLLYPGGPARFITGHYEDLNLVKVYNRIIWRLYNYYILYKEAFSLWLDCNGTKEELKQESIGKMGLK